MPVIEAFTSEAAEIVKQVVAGANQTRLTSETLPPAAYHSEAFFDLEAKAVFGSDWVCVGHTSAIPQVGDYFSIDLVGEPLVVVRVRRPYPRPVTGLPSTAGLRWSAGRGRTKLFSCPFHKWTYGLDGQLLAAPFMDESAHFDKSKCPLPEVKTEIVEDLGLIFITLGQPVDTMTDRLADFRRKYANWRMSDLAKDPQRRHGLGLQLEDPD